MNNNNRIANVWEDCCDMGCDVWMHEAEEYISAHWDDVVEDIRALVAVESVEDLAAAREGAPFGKGPRAALTRVLDIAQAMGLETHDCDGFIGFADLPGTSEKQLGIIGHVDVVAAGPGWTVPAFDVTRRDGYLMGRGVADDKGPLVVALHAVNFWRDMLARRGTRFPRTIRVLFGVNEETAMGDVAFYRAHFEDPAFLFTPDAEFPLGYGEAGICSGWLESIPLEGGALCEFEGGVAVNAVPGEAHAVIDCLAVGVDPSVLPEAAGISIELLEGARIRIGAQGKSAHASTPEFGVNAIGVLVDYLLAHNLVAPCERSFLQLQQRLLSCTDGSSFGIACSDEHFGALTAVGGMVRFEDGRIRQSIDFRYPTGVTSQQLSDAVGAIAKEYGASFALAHDKEPFLMQPTSREVQALMRAYNEVTGEEAEPFTMKGGTYARMFSTAVSFGPEKPWEEKPAWAGSMHGPDEAISEELLKQAFVIYVCAIGYLMEL